MGTEVLRPQDCLPFTNHHRIRNTPDNVFHRRKSNYPHSSHGNGIPKFNNAYRKQPVRSDRLPAQRSPMMISKRSASTGDFRYKQHSQINNNRIATSTSNNSLVSGSVAILRRGEPLQSKMEPIELGITDIYAGSAFSMSPSPRALPLPSFFSNNNNSNNNDKCGENDSATRDLRRLLGLE